MAAVSDCPAVRAAQRGLLLVESMVAALVFSVGVLGAVTVQTQANRHLGDAQYRAEAAQIAHAALGRMWTETPGGLAERYATERDGRGYRDVVASASRLPGAALPGNAPDITLAPGPSAASLTVTVVVRWQVPGEPAHRYTVAAVIARNAT